MSAITKIILGVVVYYVLAIFILTKGADIKDNIKNYIKKSKCPKCGSKNWKCLTRAFLGSETTSIKKTECDENYDESHKRTGYSYRSIYVPATRRYYENRVKCQKCGTTFLFVDSYIVE